MTITQNAAHRFFDGFFWLISEIVTRVMFVVAIGVFLVSHATMVFLHAEHHNLFTSLLIISGGAVCLFPLLGRALENALQDIRPMTQSWIHMNLKHHLQAALIWPTLLVWSSAPHFASNPILAQSLVIFCTSVIVGATLVLRRPFRALVKHHFILQTSEKRQHHTDRILHPRLAVAYTGNEDLKTQNTLWLGTSSTLARHWLDRQKQKDTPMSPDALRLHLLCKTNVQNEHLGLVITPPRLVFDRFDVWSVSDLESNSKSGVDEAVNTLLSLPDVERATKNSMAEMSKNNGFHLIFWVFPRDVDDTHISAHDLIRAKKHKTLSHL